MNLKPYTSKYISIIITLFIFTLLTRSVFLNNDLMTDQAHYAYWVQSLLNSKHFLPDQGISYLAADQNSVLHQIAVRIWNDPFRMLNLTSIATFTFISSFFNDGWQAFNFSSILISSIILVLMMLYHIDLTKEEPPKNIWLITLCVATIATQHYLFYSSTIGVHLFGVLSLIVFSMMFQRSTIRYQENPQKKLIWPLLISATFAIYAHWTNLLIIPLTVVLTNLFILKKSFLSSQNIRFLGRFFGGLFFLLLPFAASFLIRTEGLSPFFYAQSSESGNILEILLIRLNLWVHNANLIITTPYLVGGIIGAYLIRRNNPVVLPIIISHILLSVFISAFTGFAVDRVFLYIVPFLLIGLTVGTLTTRNKFVLFFMVSLALTGIGQNSLLIYSEKYFCSYNTNYCKAFLSSNQRLKSAIQEIIKSGQTPYFYEYYSRDLFCAYDPKLVHCKDPALLPLFIRLSKGSENSNQAYLEKKGVTLNLLFDTNGILISSEPIQEKITSDFKLTLIQEKKYQATPNLFLHAITYNSLREP
jgi:hypothetical protein